MTNSVDTGATSNSRFLEIASASTLTDTSFCGITGWLISGPSAVWSRSEGAIKTTFFAKVDSVLASAVTQKDVFTSVFRYWETSSA